MVYVKFREKHRGKMLKGTFLRKISSEAKAKKDIKQWNALTPSDKIIVKSITEKRPIGFRKTKFKGIYKKY